MALDSVIRQFLTLASEYWNIINYPIASFGLIGSGMALMGLFVPRLARHMTERGTPSAQLCDCRHGSLCWAVWSGDCDPILGACACDPPLCFNSNDELLCEPLFE